MGTRKFHRDCINGLHLPATVDRCICAKSCKSFCTFVQVQGQIKLEAGGVLSFGLQRYSSSKFELLAEEVLMSDSVIKLLIDGDGDVTVATSLLEASNLLVLRGASFVRSNANLGVHGQVLLNLIGPGDMIEVQRLIISLFYGIHVKKLNKVSSFWMSKC